MPCPDRYKDSQIIAEIERRKQLHHELEERERKYEVIHIEGIHKLLEVVHMVEQERVERIERTENGWLVTLNERRE